MWRTAAVGWTWTSAVMAGGFRQKLNQVAGCANIAGGMLHILSYIPGNTTRYFFEADSMWGPVKYNWGWGIGVIRLHTHTCFYIGTFPVYWNRDNNCPALAHNLLTPNTFAMSKKPRIPDVAAIESYEDNYEDMVFFLGKKNTEYYFAQKKYLDNLNAGHKRCIDQQYPKTEYDKQYKVKDALPPQEWPGAPIEEITKPTPTTAPQGPSKGAQEIIRLTLDFGISKTPNINALDLRLLEE